MDKEIRSISYLSIFISIIVILLVLIISVGLWQPAITGAVTAGDKEWENVLDVAVSDSVEVVQIEIIFDEYKPTNCADGIYIEVDRQEISFAVENEVYENGVCISTECFIYLNVILQQTRRIIT